MICFGGVLGVYILCMIEDFFYMISYCLYLLWVLVEWINDNQLILYILVDVGVFGVQVLFLVVKDGWVVFNIVECVVVWLMIDNEMVSFLVCFFGISYLVQVLISVVLVVYVCEIGQGMVLLDDILGSEIVLISDELLYEEGMLLDDMLLVSLLLKGCLNLCVVK